jgi:hypothetical protein
VIILGVPVLSGHLPGIGRVWIDGVYYRSKRSQPRRIMVVEDETVGVCRLLGEGKRSFVSWGLGGAFSAVRKE